MNLTRAAALDCAPHGIRVNAFAPGYTATHMTEGFFGHEATRGALEALHPLGGLGLGGGFGGSGGLVGWGGGGVGQWGEFCIFVFVLLVAWLVVIGVLTIHAGHDSCGWWIYGW